MQPIKDEQKLLRLRDEKSAFDPLKKLQELFGLKTFRKGQRAIIDDVLQGRDVLAIMPTGSGKSLCYQLPTQMKSGITLVVSPLIALMNDQTRHLQQLNIAAGCLHSGVSRSDQQVVFEQLRSQCRYILFVAPERVLKPQFLNWIQSAPVKQIVIDEAHCIAKWGQDFRPEYSQLGFFRQVQPHIPILALTATATKQTQKEITKSLGLKKPKIHIHGFYRSNLHLEAQLCETEEDRQAWLEQELTQLPSGRAIIYCGTRQSADDWALVLRDQGFQASSYHAGLSAQLRQQREVEFKAGKTTVLCATNAFGMGIDLADIRLVVHTCLPANMENYYQEIGRAGRDQQPAKCLLLTRKKDLSLHHYFINRSPAKLRKRLWADLRVMEEFVESRRCRHQQILGYFRDPSMVSPCGHCDNCC